MADRDSLVDRELSPTMMMMTRREEARGTLMGWEKWLGQSFKGCDARDASTKA